MTLDQMIEKRDGLFAALDELAAGDLAGEDLVRFHELEAEVGQLDERIERRQKAETMLDKTTHFMKQTETRVDVASASRSEVRAAASKMLEDEVRSQKVPVSDETAAQIEKLFGARNENIDGDYVARRFLLTENSAYRSAFKKALLQPQPAWDADEVRALNEFRAAEQSLTSASGGYGVPILIDPTVILTSGAGDAPILGVARIERITTSAWKGVSSAGVAFANEVESDPIAAQQATLAQPSVSTHKIAAFVPYSFEIEGDYPNFAGNMQAIIEQAYVDYLAVKTMTGTGTIEPWGIFTRLDTISASEVVTTTDGQLGPADALKVWAQLPERARARATWLSSVTVQNQFRNNGSTDAFFSVDLSAGGVGTMLGKRYILSDYAPSFTGTTGASNLAIVGAMDRYLIAQRIGLNVELVPHVFHSDGTPKGQRGWLAWARVGADVVDGGADLRLLQNA